MHKHLLAKLGLTAVVGFGALFAYTSPAEAAPPPQPNTVVITPDYFPEPPQATPGVMVAPTTPSTVPQPGPAGGDLPIAPPQTADQDPDDVDCQPGAFAPQCEPDPCLPGTFAPECEPENDCLPGTFAPDCPPTDEDCPQIPGAAPLDCDPDCPPPASTHGFPTDDECDDPDCPDPGSSSVPTHVPDECDDPDCPEDRDVNQSTNHPTDNPRRDECDDPDCPDIVVLNATAQPGGLDREDECDDPDCPPERTVARSSSQTTDGPGRDEECCPEDRPDVKRLDLGGEDRCDERPPCEPERGEDENCEKRPPCEPEDGEDEHCKLPRTGTDMSTYVAAGFGLTGFGAAMKALARRRRRSEG